MEQQGTVLEVKNLYKYFPGVIANNNVNFTIREREIHALIGENGAGKSTLCKMLTGVYQPDQGEILLFGEPVHFRDASESMAAGIGMVYQERNVVGYMTGAENICLGCEPVRNGVVDRRAIYARAEAIRGQLGINVPLDVPVEKMGSGETQLIEIMRALQLNPKLLILDEPTASLGENEVVPFMKFIQELRDRVGVSVIFVSHKLEEVFALADNLTILTDGESVLSAKTGEITQEECITAMIRKDKIDPIVVPEEDMTGAETVIEIEELAFDGKKRDVALHSRRGEIVGLYGLVGSGRTETMEAIYGIRRADRCRYTLNGKTVTAPNAAASIKSGMVLTPESRSNGVFGGLDLTENICSLFWDDVSSGLGFVRRDRVGAMSDKVLSKNGVKYSSAGQLISQLSGGNMQKIIIGRSIEVENLSLLIVDEPTVGMDLGAKHEIYLKLRRLVEEENKSIIFISSELDELLSVCNRICVFHEGDIIKEFAHARFNKQDILRAALKGREKHVAAS